MAARTTQEKRNDKNEVTLAVMGQDIRYIKKSVDDLNDKVDHNYVTKDEFRPVKSLVYGLVGLILVSVVGALLALVVGR